jgi:hypothetical protein
VWLLQQAVRLLDWFGMSVWLLPVKGAFSSSSVKVESFIFFRQHDLAEVFF